MNKFLPVHLRKVEGSNLTDHEIGEISSSLISLENRMSAYVPSYLVRLISTDPKPGHCSIQTQNGTLVFADVSGFTAMSEQLSELGKEGAEEITLLVNDFFERMVGISRMHGGDLIKFGGDALILLFSGSNATQLAVHTAIEMQAAMVEFDQVETSKGQFSLRMSIGVASGQVHMLSIGTSNKMDYMAAGNVLARMDEAESISQSGQIVIDMETYQNLGVLEKFEEIQPGYWLLIDSLELGSEIELFHPQSGTAESKSGTSIPLDYSVSHLAALRPYIPMALFDHLVHGATGEAYQGSHRLVTVMFVNFYGLDEVIDLLGSTKPELILKIFNAYYCSIEEIIYQHGGTISRVDSYQSGHRILALFGALRAHDNDHQRAVLAAWEMQKRLELVNQEVQALLREESSLTASIKQRIGINSGFVFASDVGSSNRREYTVMGDQVNLTARLMSVSEPGEILIGESTSKHLEPNVILDEKPAIQVKGKSKKVQRFSLVNIEEKDSSYIETSIPFTGREIELQLVRESIESVNQGQFESLLIRGNSGIGKTRFMQEIAVIASENDYNDLSSFSQSFNKNMPYNAWLKVFNSIFNIEPHMDPNESVCVDLVKHALNKINAEVWAPLFGSILNLNIPESQMTRILDAKVRRQKIFDLTIDLLSHYAAPKPLLIRFDDVQWADPVSIDLIQHVIKEVPKNPILLIFAQRMDEGMYDWADVNNLTEITLTELPDHACIQIAKDVVGKNELSEPVIELVLEKSAGNPLFIQEIMRTVKEKGFITEKTEDQLLESEELKEIEIPDSIHGLIISRVDRLPIDLRYLLQQASINGAEFSLSFLEGAFGLDTDREQLKPGVDQLVETGVIENLETDPLTYRFHHLTTRDVVYETISFRDRRRMHIQCGDYLEKNPDIAGGDRIDLLAFHFFEGQSWDKAVEYNVLAGERAKTMFANESAIDAYSKVVEAVSVGEISEELLSIICSSKESLGEVFTLVGRYEDALENYNFAFENLCGEDDEFMLQIRQADLCRKIAEVYERQSEHEDAFSWIESGLDVVDLDAPTVERAKLYLLGAGLYHRKGENDQAAEWIAESIKISEALYSDEAIQAQAQAFYLRGAIQLRTGNLSLAVESCEKSRQLYLEIQDVIGEARASNNLGIALTDLGNWDEATRALEKSLEINQEIGNIHEEGFVANNLGNIYLYKGDWERALQLFRQSNRIWKRIGALLPDAVTLSNQAQAHIYLENWSEADHLLTQAAAIFKQVGSEDFTPEVERRIGELKYKTGDIESAKDYLESSLQKAKGQKAQLEIGLTARVFGEVYLNEGNLDQARTYLEQSLDILAEIGSDHESARTLVPYARLLSQQDDVEAARDMLGQAITSFEQRGIRSDLRVAQGLLYDLLQ